MNNMKTFRTLIAAIFLGLISLSFSHPQNATYVDVTRVVDGDTIVVVFDNGIEETVRLIGVDTPETVHPTLGVEPWGPEASAFTKSNLEGERVGLELDVEQRDRFGRLLVYLWVTDELFNLTLIEVGLAEISTYVPNVKYVDLFVAAQRVAVEERVGMWIDYVCVDINAASDEELTSIVHIGLSRAWQIISLRPFVSVDDLTRVSGIGPSRLSDIKDQSLACVN